jgi:hypothetical protein
MSGSIKWLILIIFFTLISIIIHVYTVSAEEIATIIDKNGERYENVNYKIDKTFKVVTIKLEEQEKNISFTEIETIIDQEGNDITASVLGGYYRPRQETWHSESDEVFREARKKLWNIGTHLGANYSIPLGDYYEGIDPGFGIDGDLIIAVTYNTAARLTVSKSGMEIDESNFYIIPQPGFEVLDWKFSLNAFRYFVSGQYYNRPDRITAGKTIFYVYTGLGAVIHRFNLKVTTREISTGNIFKLDDTDTQSKLASTLGGGIMLMLSKNLGLDFTASLDAILLKRTSAFIMDAKIGTIVLF